MIDFVGGMIMGLMIGLAIAYTICNDYEDK